ncbi:MAG: CPBP family intramembrane metalloprotease [Proteobacteria bacterium]|nr:CPBP family intramembrane metalloprotease [Pseudomonadota bacterium]
MTAALFALAYVASVVRLAGAGIVPYEESLGLLLVMGVAFPALTAALLRHHPSPAAPATLARELVPALALLALVASYLAVGPALIDALLPPGWPADPRARALFVLARKLVLFVALPYAVLRLGFGRRAADFGLSRQALSALWGRTGIAVLVLVILLGAFQWFAGQGAAPLRAGVLGSALPAALGLSLLWNLLETGLVEEFFFRAVLQDRLAAALRSPLAGALLAGLLFGLAHAPGYYLRGGGASDAVGTHPAALDALAYAVTVPAVASFLFAILWARTRNLYAGLLVHAAVDALPGAVEIARTWGLA